MIDSKIKPKSLFNNKKTKVYKVNNNKIENIKAKKLTKEIADINLEIKNLKNKKHKLMRELKLISINKSFTLYVLKLLNNCWYVGITTDLNKRYEKHCKGKGAKWTQINKPIKIHYTKDLGYVSESEASYFENELTLEYANNYGTNCVRGGQYCQINQVFPDDLLGLNLH